MHKVIQFIKTRPLFLLLLPLFFFLHILNENFTPVLFKDCLFLIAAGIGISLCLYGFFMLLYKNTHKAALLSFSIAIFIFFFGSFSDFLLNNFGRTFILKYSFLLPVSFLLLAFLAFTLKRSNKKKFKVVFFFNLLFLFFILWELAFFSGYAIMHQSIYAKDIKSELQPCNTCEKPDIYFIVADEYAGKQQLKDLFSFDNTPFEQELANRGFHVSYNNFSNYNATVYSLASTLNLNYLSPIKNNIQTHATILESQKLIKDNSLVSFLEQTGYHIQNYSLFDLAEHKSLISDPFYASPSQIFLAQTFPKRFIRDISFNFSSSKKIEEVSRVEDSNNKKVTEAILNSISSLSPKFTYAHYTLPHHPYNYDSTGRRISVDSLNPSFKYDKSLYLSYLKYSNNYLLQIIDSIRNYSKSPPVIILISDHGFRQFSGPTDKKYYFMTLNAVYLPGNNYKGFYDGMSNVNLFRTILNTQFGQHLSMLKDSSTFLFSPENH